MQSLSKSLPVSLDSKESLLSLKEILKDVKSKQQGEERNEALHLLVSRYLSCPTKISAKRVISSFFQNLEEEPQCYVKTEICSQLLRRLNDECFQICSARHNVDTIAALMENFKLGQSCLSSIALPVIKYLVQAEGKFYSEVHSEVPPVFLNEVMHHCHVTIQTLNLVLQKNVVDNPHLSAHFVEQAEMLQTLWDLDIAILTNELFLLDCRCCSAMNAVLILQMALPGPEVAHKIPLALLPNTFNETGTLPSLLPWLTDNRADSLNMEHLSVLSCLVLAFGYIAMVSPVSVVKAMPRQGYFYLDVFLPFLLENSVRCTDTTSRTLLGKTISLFATKLFECVQKEDLPVEFIQKVDGDSEAMQSLLGYVWTNWEDQLDVVRQSAKVVFENVLQIHCCVRKVDVTSCSPSDLFLQSLTAHLFTVSWTSRGKFSALTSCVRHLGCLLLLNSRPGLPQEVVQQLQEQALSCYASELYCALFTSHKQEVGFNDSVPTASRKINSKTCKPTDTVTEALSGDNVVRNSDLQPSHAKLLETWVEPVTDAMCSSNKKLKQNIVEYLLPRLMKTGDALLNFMIQRLSACERDKPQQVRGAIITCLHRARTLGFLKSPQSLASSGVLWLGYISPDMLKEALCSMDDQIRLDGFALVCENNKTSEAVSAFEFDMLKFFIPHNTNNQSPAFRQALLALLKKLFFRVKESLLSLKRKAKGKQTSELIKTALEDYESFLRWLTTLTVDNLYPGAAFANRTSSLAILSQMTAFFSTETDGFSVPGVLNNQHIQALLGCLTDTFEENKREALRVLTCYLKHKEPIWDYAGTVETLGTAFSLACSTRPQDCDTGVYLFLTIVKQQEFYSHKLDFADILSSATKTQPVQTESAPSSSVHLLLLQFLLHSLDHQIAVADQSLVSAAASRPMYPTLHCIRYILQEVDFRAIEKSHMTAARDFIQRLLTSCLHLSRVVSPVVQNSSPEGNVPQEAVSGLDEGSDKALEAPNAEWSRALVESMPEYLVVCGWRSIKEVSLTLGGLCLQLPRELITAQEGDGGLLSLGQVEVIGEYFTQQLLESIHRGAFELAYAGFQLMCQTLWSHPLSCFYELPSLWLSAVLRDIKSGDPSSRLCATRRSAGVPFFVQAITSMEPTLTGRQSFHSAMKELLSLALLEEGQIAGPQDNVIASLDAQVHALNILRSLFRESRLGEDVVPYVADGLKAAVLGFKSEQWAVRNSATLLLSSLMTRMFGVKRSKDETAMSKKNCQTGRAFFYRYPTLYQFLLCELEAATANIGSQDRLSLHPSLYPVLLVLGRLFPSTLEGSDTSLSLSAFIPYVLKCASSPVYKTRVIASRAIQPLARRSEVISIGQSLWESLPESSSNRKVYSSQIHGSLLQLTQLIKLVESFNETLKLEALQAFGEHMKKRTWIFEKTNPCFATRQAALIFTDILLGIAKNCSTTNGDATFSVGNLKQAFVSALSDHNIRDQKTFLPFFFEFEKTRAQLCLKHLGRSDVCDTTTRISDQTSSPEQPISNPPLVLSLLLSPIYDVRLGILDALLSSIISRDSAEHSCVSPQFDVMGSEDNCQTMHSGVQGMPAELASGLYSQLKKMAMETETYHLCVEKVFYLLAFLPQGSFQLQKERRANLLQILSALVGRILTERRTEVKAAIMRFSGRLVSILYERELDSDKAKDSPSLASDRGTCCRDEVSSVLRRWVSVLRQSCVADENPDLQLSCCHVLLESAKHLLEDPLRLLEESVYVVWDSLAMLLQDDDLEVKEVAASVVSVLLGKEQGSYQPRYALHVLPSALLSLHGERDLNGVVCCLIGWALEDGSVDVKESEERLFDKGELNTYLDHVAFTRSILGCLVRLLSVSQEEQQLPSPQNSSADQLHDRAVADVSVSHQAVSDCQRNPTLVFFLENSVEKLQADLKVLSCTCKKEDMYMNHGRFTSLYQTVHKAKFCLCLCSDLAPENSSLEKLRDCLKSQVSHISTNLKLIDSLI